MTGHVDAEVRATHALLDAASVQRVVLVDDIYGVSIGQVVAACHADHTIADDLGVDAGAPQTVLEGAVEGAWRGLAPGAAREMGLRVVAALGGGGPDDVEAAGLLARLLGNGIEVVELAPDEWSEQKEGLVGDTKTVATLFLFDLSFSTPVPDEAGLKELTDTLAECSPTSVCGLITHTVTPADEVSRWEKWSDDDARPRSRFLVISKQHLTGEADLAGFARMLKLTLVNKHCDALRTRTGELLKSAVDEACEALRSLNVFDFEHVVFRMSRREGAYEPDTLLRLFDAQIGAAIRTAVRKDPVVLDRATQLRAFSSTSVSADDQPSPQIRRLRHQELYASADEVNAVYLPLQLGDLFERTSTSGAKRLYVLVAQPCDLALRHDGKRVGLEAFLCEIATGPAEHPHLHHELRHWDVTNARVVHYVRFGQRHCVVLDALDLCCSNMGGCAQTTLGAPPPGLLTPWQAERHKLTQRFAEAYVSLLTQPNIGQQLQAHVERSTSNHFAKASKGRGRLFDATAREDDDGRHLAFNFRRVGRIRQPVAGDLLVRFCQCGSRGAFPRDYAEPEDPN